MKPSKPISDHRQPSASKRWVTRRAEGSYTSRIVRRRMLGTGRFARWEEVERAWREAEREGR